MLRALGLAAAFAAAGAFAARACDPVTLLEYDVQGGWWQIEVNGVYLDSGASQFASGGAPIKDWLLRGDNTVTVKLEADKGDFSLYRICEDGSDRKDFAKASLTGRSSEELGFSVEAPPLRLFLDQEPVSDDGLLKAVEDLKAAFTARDADAVWRLHAALQADMALNGQKTGAAQWQMGKVVENIEPDFAANLRARPVLGGRVWEVFGDDFAPPISDEVAMNGGSVPFQTGSFWMRRNGEWSVLVK